MKLKFNWGTGIFLFIILFLLTCAAFIIFTVQQDVNLVHEDYYEKGTDYSEQININQRSEKYKDQIEIIYLEKFLIVNISASLSSEIDSGRVVLYRPSDRKYDFSIPVERQSTKITVQKDKLQLGRYILKFYWNADGLKYEVDQTINVQ